MGILDYVSNSTPTSGLRVVFAGVEGVGKTTLAASAPRALFVPFEQGFGSVKIAKTPMLEHYTHTLALLDEITAAAQAGKFPYRSLVFDTATALERQIHECVLQADPMWAKGNRKALTMESALGGYGKAYQYANELFATFLAKCDLLAMHGGINIILTCHVFAAKVIDPTAGEYDSWDLLLHSPKNQKAYGKREMLTQWADIVGFLHEPLFVSKGAGKSDFAMGMTANKGHVLAVNRTPSYVAKNRYGVVQDIPLPKEDGWNHLAHAVYQACGIDVYNRG